MKQLHQRKSKNKKYLAPILSVISKRDDIEVDLLIGVNFFKTLEPIKVISSKTQGT